MKKLLFLFLLLPTFCFSQRIQSEKGDIIDLKLDSSQYINVIFVTGGLVSNHTVIFNNNLPWSFIDSNDKKEKFANITLLMNYMYKYDWEFLCFLPKSAESTATIMTFKRKK